MIELKDKEFAALSKFTQIPACDIRKLYELGLLDIDNSVKALAREDFKLLSKHKEYTTEQMALRVAQKYHCTKEQIKRIMVKKPIKFHYCKECGARVITRKFKRNNGLCDNCVIKRIDI